MIFVDTNLFMRLLVGDVVEQQKEAIVFFKKAMDGEIECFSSTIVFFEIYWLLENQYKKPKEEIVEALYGVLSMRAVYFTESDILRKSIHIYNETNLGLEDSYNIVYSKVGKATDFKTFDKKLTNYLKRSKS